MKRKMVPIPQALYDKIAVVADEAGRSAEDVIAAMLSEAVGDPDANYSISEPSEQEALAYLSDDALWTIAHEQLPAKRQRVIDELLEKKRDGSISRREQAKLEQMALRGAQLMLRKSNAMRILLSRGYDVTLDDLVVNR